MQDPVGLCGTPYTYSIFIHGDVELCEQISQKNKQPEKKNERVTFICDIKSLLHNLRHAVWGPRFPL